MNEILNIINSTFEKDYFLDKGSPKTEMNLKNQIDSFNHTYPTAQKDFLENLRYNFVDAKIENFTHFFDLDRCIRFLVEMENDRRFVCQLSIYGYFSVYESPSRLENEKYTYGTKEFIDKNNLEICDTLFNCSNVISKPPIWLTKEILNETIFDFSIPNINYESKIKIADCLFTSHYI